MKQHRVALATTLSLAVLTVTTVFTGASPLFAQTAAHGPETTNRNAKTRLDGRTAPLLTGLGNHARPVTTNAPLAQKFFNQGLILCYAFNHAEAVRSFKEAVRLDPDCAMAYWGIAFALGPNINAAMPEAAAKEARSAMQEAVRRAGQASAKEQALIGALAKRYSDDPKAERAALDAVYANAMRAIAAKFPDDTDILTITGEAIMDTTPWNYWTKDGKPNPGTEEVIGLLEKTLAIDPTHPGANHFYIHIVEASPFPERALSSAHRLPEITPLAGHLVHMPSHIYVRTGRYHEAVLVNERSILADSEYLTQCSRQGMYPMIYVPHNHHFLWFSATMEGASAKAIAAAEKMAAHVDKKAMRSPEMGILQNFALTPLFAKIRFGRWDEIIALPAPDKELLYPTGMWHYARGMAFARRGQHDAARKELAAVTAIASDKSLEPVSIGGLNPVTNVLKIAAAALAGEVAAEGGDFEAAISHFEKGIALQDTLNYDEPPAFHYPVRQSLGAVLLAAGRPAEAERVYREDLKRHPENGWSLFGLLQSLRALGNNTLAADTERRFREAWKHADVTLTSSRF